MRRKLCAFVFGLFGSPVFANTIGEMQFELPTGWVQKQGVLDGDTRIQAFAAPDLATNTAVVLYARPGSEVNLQQMFAYQAQVIDSSTRENGGLVWNTLNSKKTNSYTKKTYYVSSFGTVHNGMAYYGYARSEQQADAVNKAQNFMNALHP